MKYVFIIAFSKRNSYHFIFCKSGIIKISGFAAGSNVFVQVFQFDIEDGGLHGILHPLAAHQPAWRMAFVKADGWTPAEGELRVEAVYLSGIPWPVLLLHPDGLLVPRGKPRRVE